MRIICIVLFTLSISVCYAQVDSLMNIGREHARKGDYETASLWFIKALKVSDHAFDQGMILNNLGLMKIYRGDFPKAVDYLNSAIEQYENGNDKEKIARTCLNLGSTYRRMKQYSKAKDTYNKAYLFAQTNKTKASALNNIGRLIFTSGDYKKGIEYFKNLLSESEIYLIHQNIARLYAKMNQIDSAQIHYKKAVRIHGSQFSPVSIELNKELGDMLYAAGRLNDAALVYFDALYSCDQLQKLYLIDKTKLKSGEVYKAIYISAIECVAKLNDEVSVLNLMERLKAPVLSEKIRANSLPDSVVIQLKKLDYEIEKALESDFDGLDYIISEKKSLLQHYPIPERNDYHKVLENIPRDMAIVHYTYSDSMLTTYVGYNKESKIIQKPIEKQFFTDLELVAKQTRLFSSDTFGKYKLYVAALNRLCAFFQPDYPKEVKRLLILPYDELYRVPFEALTNSKASQEWADYTDMKYLVNDYAISYSSSISSLQNSKGGHINKAIAFIPRYSVDSLQLKYNLAEANELKRNFDTDIIQGRRATRTSFFSEIGNYDIISIIAHGNNCEIIFDRDTIKAEELYKLHLSNPLTVLSACRTNSGDLQSIEGYFGTARKFIEAGSVSVLASGWAIPDESTQKIMSDFYKNLSGGEPKDIALQKAKVDYLKNHFSIHRSPAFWSGIVLIGNTSSINLPNSKLYVFSGVVGILLLLTFVVKYFRGKF